MIEAEAIAISVLVALVIGLAVNFNIRASLRAQNTSSAFAGRDEYGDASPRVRNLGQSVIGLPRCGGEGSNLPDISPRASGQTFIGTFQGVPVYGDPEFPA